MTDEQAMSLLATLPGTMAEAILRRAREPEEYPDNCDRIVGVRAACQSPPRTKLSDLVGSWEEDPAFEEAIAAFEMIDEDLWR